MRIFDHWCLVYKSNKSFCSLQVFCRSKCYFKPYFKYFHTIPGKGKFAEKCLYIWNRIVTAHFFISPFNTVNSEMENIHRRKMS